MLRRRFTLRLLGAAGYAAVSGVWLGAQTPARVIRTVDDSQVIRPAGNTARQIRGAQDLGAAPADLPLQHMLLVLRRSPAQDADLRQLLDEQRENDSPSYHLWLTPAQFGQRFGPAPADVAAVTQWLIRQGFQIDEVAPGGGVIEFSGTAATVANGLHTEIHRYSVQGTPHWANATDPAIPAALAPVVAGIVSLNDFRKAPASRIIGQGRAARPSPGVPGPSLTVTDQSGAVVHALVPGDLATIYNIAPLFGQLPAINGSGETIALVARSDIYSNDFSEFRQLFQPSAPTNALNTIEVGTDPGIATNGDQDEATLDAEWAGAAAPQATIDLVVSGGTLTTDGVDLAAQYIVDHNLAPVMSTSFGQCESLLGAAEDQFWSNLWEQAAAQGITALVSAGDDGAAGCDLDTSATAAQGLAVSGIASTPFDLAVGGTEFNEGGNDAAYWGSANGADFTSALGYIPEIPWDESALVAGGSELWSGSGGVSTLYAKPAWQAGPGVPADGQRDLPDVSLNAAGHDGYVVCYQNSCTVGGGSFSFYVVSGTSAASPSLAGVMAQVNQQTGSRQGLANRVFYKLAAQAGAPAVCYASAPPASNCVFHDVTTGNNFIPCIAGTNGCNNGQLGFSATPGYDLVTGLGSVNAANLANEWSSAGFSSSQTTLTLSPPANLVHGQSVPLTIQVAPGNGGTETPSGTVELLAEYSDGTISPVQSFALDTNGQVSATTTLLPGGAYNVVASYAGDLNFGTSTSSPVAVTVGKENATVQLSVFTLNAQGQQLPVTTMTYGDAVYVSAQVAGASGQGVPSGTVTFSNTANGNPNYYPFCCPILTPTVSLDSQGSGSGPGFLIGFPGGVNTLTAQYSGDISFNTANSAPSAITINKGPTNLVLANSTSGSGPLTLTLTLNTQVLAASKLPSPFANIQIFAGSTQVATVSLGNVSSDPTTGFYVESGTVSPQTIPGTTAALTAQFSGDSYYLPSTSNSLTVTTPPNLVFSPNSLNFGTVYVGTTSAPVSTTLTNQGGTGATLSRGTSPNVSESDNCGGTLAALASCTVTLTFHPTQIAEFPQGPIINGIYIQMIATVPSFSLSVASPAPIAPGQSAIIPITVAPVGGFAGAVSLSCSSLPPLSTCTFSPSSVTLDGTHNATAQLTVATTAPPASGSTPRGPLLPWWWFTGLLLALLAPLGAILRIVARRRPLSFTASRPRMILAAFVLALLAACGGNPGPPPPPPPAVPAVTVTPGALAFGSVLVGQKVTQPLTVANTSQGTLQFFQFSINPATGTPVNDFAQTNTCPNQLSPGGQCAVSVVFAPTVGIAESASLSIGDNVPGPTQTVALTGTGEFSSTTPGSYYITVTGTASGPLVITTTANVTVN